MRKLTLWGVGALLAAGCAQQKAMTKVDDSGLARLDESQMAPVDDARIEEGRANDAVAKARAAEADARARLEVAKSEKDVAQAQLKRSIAERDLLKKQYAPPDQIARAEQDIAAAQDRVKATDLKLAYLNQLIAVAETERKAAEAHVITAHAATELAKYRAMKAGNAPQAAAVNPGDLEQQLAAARAHEAQLQREAAEQRSNAVALYNRWQQADSSARTLARPENLPVPPPTSEPSK
jgi:hypothetical protein